MTKLTRWNTHKIYLNSVKWKKLCFINTLIKTWKCLRKFLIQSGVAFAKIFKKPLQNLCSVGYKVQFHWRFIGLQIYSDIILSLLLSLKSVVLGLDILRSVFTIQSKIYNGAFLRNRLSALAIFAKNLHRRYSTGF